MPKEPAAEASKSAPDNSQHETVSEQVVASAAPPPPPPPPPIPPAAQPPGATVPPPPQYAQPQYAQPQYGSQPQYAQSQYGPPQQAVAGYPPYQRMPENPGQSMGIASLVTSLLGLGLIGLILGIVGLSQSKKAGQGNGMAIAGIIIGAIGMIVATIAIIVVIVAGITLANYCDENGPGIHYEGNTKYTCG